MNGEPLLELTIRGKVSTNSNRDEIHEWRENLETHFASLLSCRVDKRRISVEVKIWLSTDRLGFSRRNDLDNLVKPILDTMKKMRLIEDDSDVFHLEVTKFPTKGEEGVHVKIRDWN
jgi:Holliday junction resolvase RusA-like endonuclease